MYELIYFFVVIVASYTIGSIIEKRHFARLREDEYVVRDVPVLNSKTVSPSWNVEQVHLVQGEVVISIDYFKKFAGGIRQIFGGEIGSYEAVFDRARREALVRMRKRAKELGANVVINTRIETSQIGMSKGGSGTGCSEIVAYGTALKIAGGLK
ncbi:MAG: YbjQ family protein [Bdellovibrionales bacterium]|nr:YbjQ family protein [Bdellovibrionales bacterium]